MQQINPEEIHDSWQDGYGKYTEQPMYSNQFDEHPGQKLDADTDEEFVDFLTQKIRQELKDRVTEQEKHYIDQRLILALVSVCAVALMFSLFILTLAFGHLSSDSMSAIGGAMFGASCAIIAINGYFHWASSTINKNKEKKG